MKMSISSMSAKTFYDARQKISVKEVSPDVVMDRNRERTITLIQVTGPAAGATKLLGPPAKNPMNHRVTD